MAASQRVETLNLGLAQRRREDVVLDLLDLALDGFEHRHVVVDDEIEDRVEDVVLAVREHLRRGLAARAHRRVSRGRAVTDRDHIAPADEEVRLAEGDAAVEHLRRAGYDEERVAVLLDQSFHFEGAFRGHGGRQAGRSGDHCILKLPGRQALSGP